MKLKCILIADPKAEVARLVADQCSRLADERLVATTVAAALRDIEKHQPELVVLSLELIGANSNELIPKILKLAPDSLLVATYRELSVPNMEKLSDLGIVDLVEQPVDVVHIYRAASRRFRVPFRRHDRFTVSLDVTRADGVLIGKAVDLSEGGMQMTAFHPMTTGESIFIDLALPEDKPLRVRCHILEVQGQAPMPVTARMQFANLRGPDHRRLVRFLEKLGGKRG